MDIVVSGTPLLLVVLPCYGLYSPVMDIVVSGTPLLLVVLPVMGCTPLLWVLL